MSEFTPENEVDPNEGEQPTEVTPEAPQASEPAPVEVSPADQSEVLKTDNIHGKDYTVTADRGYRLS